MIEVMRQAQIDLDKLIHEKEFGYVRAMRLSIYFDNCGENKNKVMFCYLSALVERGDYDDIWCSFLIVGHTHCMIDRYFSILSKIIKNWREVNFIGTPM